MLQLYIYIYIYIYVCMYVLHAPFLPWTPIFQSFRAIDFIIRLKLSPQLTGYSRRLRTRVRVDKILPAPVPTPAKTFDFDRLQLQLRLRFRSPGWSRLKVLQYRKKHSPVDVPIPGESSRFLLRAICSSSEPTTLILNILYLLIQQNLH